MSTKSAMDQLEEDFETILKNTKSQLDREFATGYALKNPQVLARAIELKGVLYRVICTNQSFIETK